MTGTLRVDPETVEALADLLGAEDLDTAVGAPLPPLWHWAALARWRPWSALGPDGHAEDPDMPTRADLPRRMFAGGAVTVNRPLRVGADITLTQAVEQVRDTEGRSGPLRFVTLRRLVHDETGVALDERQDIVYRAAPTTSGPPTGASEPGSDRGAGLDRTGEPWRFSADSSLLLRFSALTRNSHRIHHDHPYVTGVEGYADLVVHGPLLAIVLAERVRAEGRPVQRLEHRGRAALLARREAEIALDVVPDGTSTVTLTSDGAAVSELTTHHAQHPEESS